MAVVTIGLDIAKNVFQVHGIRPDGRVEVRRQLRRSQLLAFFRDLPPCVVGIEACPGGHHWARRLVALGHEVRLIPPQYVKPYVKRHKNDAADAEAICEAVTRPTMRFVPIKTEEQQAVLMLHRTRELLIRQKNMLANALRAQLSEFGVVAAQGRGGLGDLLRLVAGVPVPGVPDLAREVMAVLAGQLGDVVGRLRALETRIAQIHKADPVSRTLATIPGVGPIIASAVAASVTDPKRFRNGRQFAAWLGLVPRQRSTGGKERLGGISKWGDAYIRKLLVVASHALIRYARGKAPTASWLAGLLERRPTRVAAVAMANKTARIIWAVLAEGRPFRRAAAGAPA
jgi:transposase